MNNAFASAADHTRGKLLLCTTTRDYGAANEPERPCKRFRPPSAHHSTTGKKFVSSSVPFLSVCFSSFRFSAVFFFFLAGDGLSSSFPPSDSHRSSTSTFSPSDPDSGFARFFPLPFPTVTDFASSSLFTSSSIFASFAESASSGFNASSSTSFCALVLLFPFTDEVEGGEVDFLIGAGGEADNLFGDEVEAVDFEGDEAACLAKNESSEPFFCATGCER